MVVVDNGAGQIDLRPEGNRHAAHRQKDRPYRRTRGSGRGVAVYNYPLNHTFPSLPGI